jgi:glucokinase
MPESKQEYVVGVDLGGTKILAGVFDSQMKCIARAKLSTKAQRGPDIVIGRIARCIEDVIDESDLSLKEIKAIGVGAPGTVDTDSGRVRDAGNLSGWQDVPLKKDLEKKLDVPIHIDNDCNLSALGVYEVELNSKPKSLVGIFLGTGIGGGVVMDGKLIPGFTQVAGEIGHMVLVVGGPKCSCGNRGCFEALAARPAIYRRIENGIKDGEKTMLTEMVGNSLDNLRTGDLRKAIRKGDKFVEKVVEEAAEYTGIAVANIVNILNPETIVLGGGVIEGLQDEMMAIIVETARDYAMPGATKGVDIFATKLDDDAGITGAAVLARRAGK